MTRGAVWLVILSGVLCFWGCVLALAIGWGWL